MSDKRRDYWIEVGRGGRRVRQRCGEITHMNQRTIIADGVVLTLDEDILNITATDHADDTDGEDAR